MNLQMSKLLKQMEDGAGNLPSDCWQSIFSRLSKDDLKTISMVCKDFLKNSNLISESLKVVHPKVSMLSQHLQRFRQLKKIDLSDIDFTGNLDEAIHEVACSDLHLEALDISHEALKTENLRELGSNPNMKNLKALNCILTDVVPDIDLVVIANSFPSLEELSVRIFPEKLLLAEDSPPPFPTVNGVEFLASKLNFLKKIYIFGKHNVSDRSLTALSLNCLFLKDVTIMYSCPIHYDDTHVTENGVGLLLRNRPNLEALSITYVRKDAESTITVENSISYAKALTSLELCGMDNTDKILIAIAQAKLRLKNLALYGCQNVSFSALLMVLSDYLTRLHMVEVDIMDMDTYSALLLLSARCPSLVEIKLWSWDEQVNNGDINIPLSKNHSIRDLHLHYCSRINDESLKQFGLMFPNLKDLSLLGCNQITSTGIEAVLKSCKCIRRLMLNGYERAKIIEADSELLETDLEDLFIATSGIDDEGLAAIAKKCPRLVSLDLNHCRNVTIEAMEQMVQNLKTLKRLCCSDHVNLLGWMLSTGNLASLKKIFVGASDITEEQRDQFLNRGCLLLKGGMSMMRT